MHDIVIIIPARGGSKGIPRKNLRLLNGKPLIFYSIRTALSSKYNPDVYVTSDDGEILHLAEQFGAKIHERDMSLSDDKTTLDPVIYNCYQYAKKKENKDYSIIVTLQPTSPLLKKESLDDAITKMLINSSIDTIISATDNTHLTWRKENGKFIPNYTERLNRQYLPKIYKETGGFLITRKEIIRPDNRIGENVDLYLLSGGEGIDIDNYEDWQICEYLLKKKHILFVVTGNSEVGLGHVYNSLIIANDILDHKISFLVDKNSKMAYDKIALKNYPVYKQESENILDDIKNLKPDIVINDILDTTTEYIMNLKKLNCKIINFEDLGDGAKLADLVINAIYPEKHVIPNHYFGHKYFLLRDEFIYAPKKKISDKVEKVLITFGGVDPNNYAKKVLESIYDYCQQNNIHINVISGFGYNKLDTIRDFRNIDILTNVNNISKYMYEADIIFTSAGRTVYEIASIGTPAIVLSQNERELTHFFASSEYGFINLGLGYRVTDEEIYKSFFHLVNSAETRKYMHSLMLKYNLKEGRKNVVKLIRSVIEE